MEERYVGEIWTKPPSLSLFEEALEPVWITRANDMGLGLCVVWESEGYVF